MECWGPGRSSGKERHGAGKGGHGAVAPSPVVGGARLLLAASPVVEGRGVDVQGDQAARSAFNVLHGRLRRKLQGGLLNDSGGFWAFRKDVHLLPQALGRDAHAGDCEGELFRRGLSGRLEAGKPEAHHDDHEPGDGAEGDPVPGTSPRRGKEFVKLCKTCDCIKDADDECKSCIACLDGFILLNYCFFDSIGIEGDARFGIFLAYILISSIFHFLLPFLELYCHWQEKCI